MEHHGNRRANSAELSISALVVSDQRIELILRVKDGLIACCECGDDVAVCAVLDI